MFFFFNRYWSKNTSKIYGKKSFLCEKKEKYEYEKINQSSCLNSREELRIKKKNSRIVQLKKLKYTLEMFYRCFKK